MAILAEFCSIFILGSLFGAVLGYIIAAIMSANEGDDNE